ncbi:MAG TPA: hypothetical protein VFT29_11730 [Gemmatimonadaceae bacterium]|nr:hypothetical protein [Gemmatimonadaceae bacterium]
MSRFAAPFRTAVLLASWLVLTPSAASAQRYHDDDVDGADICRPIWREFGRTMNGRPRAVHCEVRDVGTLPATSRVSVDGEERNGVRVRGAQRRDTRVRLVIQAQGGTIDEARELVRKVSLDLSQTPLRVSGTTTGDDWRRDRRFVSATIVVDVPQRSNVTAQVNYAPLDVEGVIGEMDLRADHGPLTLSDIGGDVRAHVEYGPISVSLSGAKWQGAGLDAVAHYGPVTLRVPRNFGAELEIGARNGPLDVDFPITLTRFNGSRITTTLGAGGPRVRAVAEYGPMSLRVNRDTSR